MERIKEEKEKMKNNNSSWGVLEPRTSLVYRAVTFSGGLGNP